MRGRREDAAAAWQLEAVRTCGEVPAAVRRGSAAAHVVGMLRLPARPVVVVLLLLVLLLLVVVGVVVLGATIRGGRGCILVGGARAAHVPQRCVVAAAAAACAVSHRGRAAMRAPSVEPSPSGARGGGGRRSPSSDAH